MSQIQYISVDKLDPHPDNPRKDLGDLAEIAASIKQNGILQNLTVVPCISDTDCAPWDDNETTQRYRIVIGHRRLAAAKLAGLTVVPCVVSDMTHPDQVRCMLMENMQRSDLTVYEQAEGFQMMLNLGDGLDDIATKTGFSESTVRRRVKLLELDREKFKESSDRGATLFDYAELEKIKDIDQRNKVLELVGTDNFKYALKQALDAQDTAERLAALTERLSAFATQIDDTGDGNYSHIKYIGASTEIDSIEAPEDADTTAYFFVVSGSYIQLYKEKSDSVSAEEDAAKAERDALEEARMELRVKLGNIAACTHQLRYEFVQSVSATKIKNNLGAIMAASLRERLGNYTRLDEGELCNLLGVTLLDSDADGYDAETEHAKLADAIKAAPVKALFYAVYCNYGDSAGNSYHQHYYGTHRENNSLNRLYDLLEVLGYKASDEEKAMRDGTHELFGTDAEPETDTDSKRAA